MNATARSRLAWTIAIFTVALAGLTVLLYALDPAAVGQASTDTANGGTRWGTAGPSCGSTCRPARSHRQRSEGAPAERLW